jgi:hypothetical protein
MIVLNAIFQTKYSSGFLDMNNHIEMSFLMYQVGSLYSFSGGVEVYPYWLSLV